jgi:excisionase family DNA binding protein
MSAPVMTRELYTVKEVADLLRVSPRTVRKMIAEGELPALKIRDEWRIEQRDIDTLIERQKTMQEEGP